MKKKGFIATSLIYSFFLVFLILMTGILVSSVNKRMLVNSLKKDIRVSLESQSGFVADKLEKNAYTLGEEVQYAGEIWQVMKESPASATTVLLILKNGLNSEAITSSITNSEGKNISNAVYYGACSTSGCLARACRDVPAYSYNASGEPVDSSGRVINGLYGKDTCYYDTRHTNQFMKPTWMPVEDTSKNIHQVTTNNNGQMIISDILNSWFRTHAGLSKALRKNKLKSFTFSDGYFNYPQVVGSYRQDPIYVRLPLLTELTNTNGWNGVVPFHVIGRISGMTDTQIRIYNASRAVQTVTSNTLAYIRPVIEVIKG